MAFTRHCRVDKDINLIPSTDDALPDNLQAHSEVMTKEIPQVKSHDKPTYFVDLLINTWEYFSWNFKHLTFKVLKFQMQLFEISSNT